MVTHMVFFKMLPQAGGNAATANAAELVRRLEALPAQIPALLSLSVGVDFSDTPASWHVGLHTTFANRADLEVYRVHPAHVAVVEFVKATTSDRCVVDFEH